jgi:hypothetical protein
MDVNDNGLTTLYLLGENPGARWVAGWVGPRVGLDTPGIKSHFPVIQPYTIRCCAD